MARSPGSPLLVAFSYGVIVARVEEGLVRVGDERRHRRAQGRDKRVRAIGPRL
jgi:hypothetical protein